VHWHGLRLENRYDGTHDTQAPIPVSETYLPGARARPGAYWYHPHIREDYGQELGLYGNILVTPSVPTTGRPPTASCCSPRRHLIEDGQIAAFRESETTHRDGPLRQCNARRR
jgi:FtsP/CotA-like multicopper oxidase with cupredoxin domain